MFVKKVLYGYDLSPGPDSQNRPASDRQPTEIIGINGRIESGSDRVMNHALLYFTWLCCQVHRQFPRKTIEDRWYPCKPRLDRIHEFLIAPDSAIGVRSGGAFLPDSSSEDGDGRGAGQAECKNRTKAEDGHHPRDH